MAYRIAQWIVGVIIWAQAGLTHEYWIEGHLSADELVLDVKVGENLSGTSLPYLPDQMVDVRWVSGGAGRIKGRLGDKPVARLAMDRAQGAAIFLEAAPRRLVHSDADIFEEYLRYEGLSSILARHEDRGLPRQGFVETYARHAKFLALSDAGHVPENEAGAVVEIVLDQVVVQSGLRLSGRLVREGAGLAGHQISVFQGKRRVKVVRSAAGGAFVVQLENNAPVMLNTVVIAPVTQGEAVWHSDWASLYLLSCPEPHAKNLNRVELPDITDFKALSDA